MGSPVAILPTLRTFRRVRALAGLAALLAALAVPGGARAAGEGEFFGVSAPELYSMSLDGRTELRDAALARIEAAGVESVRTEIGWRDVQPRAPFLGDGAFDWSAVDGHVLALAERSQRLMPILMAPPSWAQDPESASGCERRGMVAAEHVADYGRYAAEVAKRYGRGGFFWRLIDHFRPDVPRRPITTYELWNEPNWDAFSCPAVNPEVYAAAVAAAADEIHAVDPGATVAIGGLVILERDRLEGERLVGMETRRFLGRMAAAQPTLAAKVDAVALHTYWATPADNLRAIALAEGWLEAAGLAEKELIVSEFGWQTGVGADAVTEGGKARMIGAYADALAGLDCRVDSVYPHNWISARSDPLEPEDWYGLADPANGAPLASGAAYAQAIAANASAGDDACEVQPSPAPVPPVAGAPAQPAQPPAGSQPSAGGPLAIEVVSAPSKTAKRRPVVRFRLVGAVRAVRFDAILDGERRRRVRSPLRLPRLGLGRHVLRLRARAEGGAVASRTIRFRVVRRAGR